MTVTKIALLNPRVWGITINFKVVEKFDARSVNFKDGSEHKIGEFLIADDSASIILSVWDETIDKIKVGKCYELTEARMNVFNNNMKINMSRKSEINELSEEIIPNLDEKMSEKHFEQPRKFGYKKNNYQKKLF